MFGIKKKKKKDSQLSRYVKNRSIFCAVARKIDRDFDDFIGCTRVFFSS